LRTHQGICTYSDRGGRLNMVRILRADAARTLNQGA
jgi:hypothetical protein